MRVMLLVMVVLCVALSDCNSPMGCEWLEEHPSLTEPLYKVMKEPDGNRSIGLKWNDGVCQIEFSYDSVNDRPQICNPHFPGVCLISMKCSTCTEMRQNLYMMLNDLVKGNSLNGGNGWVKMVPAIGRTFHHIMMCTKEDNIFRHVIMDFKGAEFRGSTPEYPAYPRDALTADVQDYYAPTTAFTCILNTLGYSVAAIMKPEPYVKRRGFMAYVRELDCIRYLFVAKTVNRWCARLKEAYDGGKFTDYIDDNLEHLQCVHDTMPDVTLYAPLDRGTAEEKKAYDELGVIVYEDIDELLSLFLSN